MLGVGDVGELGRELFPGLSGAGREGVSPDEEAVVGLQVDQVRQGVAERDTLKP